MTDWRQRVDDKLVKLVLVMPLKYEKKDSLHIIFFSVHAVSRTQQGRQRKGT